MREPAFWWCSQGLASALLSPLAAIYGAVAAGRMAQRGTSIDLPVICVGNFTLGGSGKTPTAIAIARLLHETGRKPTLLSRGYGGSLAGPIAVDPHGHTASEVGDEALLLAHAATTIVARERVAGAKAARAAGADVIVMDDGLQNPSLIKDLSIAVIDGGRGVGNGKVFPAGPLRAPLAAQLDHVDALLVVGNGNVAKDVSAQAKDRALPVFHGEFVPEHDAVAGLGGARALAFAGIGNPDKFFATVAAAGIEAAHCRAFPDHHRYTAEEAAALIMQAEREGLQLLTTTKDHMRMTGDVVLAALAQRTRMLPVDLKVEEDAWRDLVLKAASRSSRLDKSL